MTASIKTIKSYLRVDDAQARGIRAAMKLGEAGSREASDAMEAINGILDGHGVEAVRGDYHVDRYHYDIVATYVNMGDTYNGTVLYETETGKFIVTAWGDWVEQKSKKYGIY
jgi:hypothetical protein